MSRGKSGTLIEMRRGRGPFDTMEQQKDVLLASQASKQHKLECNGLLSMHQSMSSKIGTSVHPEFSRFVCFSAG
jgi:hypothetical protein